MKQNARYTLNINQEQKKTAIDNKIKYVLIWYDFYDLWPGDGQ